MGGPSYIWFEGHRLDARTRDMVVALRVVCDAPVVITQGCYNAGGVAASAGTHDGGGAVDIRMIGLTEAQQKEVETKARKIGFAAWIRQPIKGLWPLHCHMIAIGCPDLAGDRDMGTGAIGQVQDYKNGRNGLANNGPDTGTRAYVNWTWEKYARTYPDLLTEDWMSTQDATDIKNALAGLRTYLEACTVQIQKHDDQTDAVLSAKIDALTKQEADRYKVYFGNLKSILTAVAADDANDVTKADVDRILAEVQATSAKVDAVSTKVDALPKA